MANYSREKMIVDNRNPKGLPPMDDCATLVNAVSTATEMPWVDSFKLLYKQAHKLCRMPSDVKSMLSELHFFQQPTPKEYISLSDYLDHFDKNYANGEIAILKLRDRYVSVCARTFCGSYYHVIKSQTNDFNGAVNEIWIKWLDNQDHSPKKRGKGGRKSTRVFSTAVESDSLHVVNKNPDNNRVGDCVVRGMSACLDLDWHETLDALAEASEYLYPTINYQGIYDHLLIEKGFVKNNPLKKNGKLLTGAEFCAYIRDMYPEGTIFLAHIGRHHVAAIRLLEDGYKIYDTWNSAEGPKIDMFWVKYPDRTKKRTKREPEVVKESNPIIIQIGSKIIHKQYGVGAITNIGNGASYTFVEIDFASKGVKKFEKAWVINNCLPADQ